MKNKVLGGLAALAVVALMVTLMLPRPSVQASSASSSGRLEVRGVGAIEVRPDQAIVVFRLFALEPTAGEAQSVNAVNLRAVQDVLKALGIDQQAVRTRSITLREEWEYLRDQREFRGYLAEHVLAVTVDDLTQVGEVLDRVIQASNATVQGVEFGLRDRREAEKLALREAYAHAAGRAQVLAESAGIRLGAPSAMIDESVAVAALPLSMDQAMLRASMAYESSTPVHPGMIRVEAKVRLEYVY